MANSDVPIDRGFAWIVLLSCSLIRLLVDGFWVSLGIFYVGWQLRFDATATSIAWIGFAFLLIIFATGPLASALGHKFSYKVATIFSGILVSTSLFSLSFISELWHIYIIFPLCGMGMGIAYQTASAFFVHYFDKRFAFASLLNGSASGIGIFVIPPLLELLNSFYGINGTLIISAGIMLNISACGMLLRHPNWEINRTPPQQNDTKIKDDGSEVLHSNIKAVYSQTETQHDQNCSLKYVLSAISESLDFSLFLEVRFLFQCVLTSFMYGAAAVVAVYMVPYGVEAGVSALKAAFLVSVIGICMLCIRLLTPIGWLIDKKIISPSLLGGISTICGGFFTMIFPFTKSYLQMVLTTVAFGVAVPGIGASMVPLLVRDASGSSKKATSGLAYSNFLYGVGAVTGNLITGYMYDVTGNFIAAYLFMGSCFLCMGISMLLDPCLIRWTTHTLDTQQSNNDETNTEIGNQEVLTVTNSGLWNREATKSRVTHVLSEKDMCQLPPPPRCTEV